MAKKSFENALTRLEQITEELEAGDLTLEKSLAKFSEGIELARFCNATLEDARGRVELLLGANGSLVATPFAGEDDGNQDLSE
ncbi:MAG: exodeoxyribonuclease VII small subunit [Desulfobulbaceae bacterium]|nr:exodeoxyribonuclease VII small subunit [Desulfobulbaceae bacterium]